MISHTFYLLSGASGEASPLRPEDRRRPMPLGDQLAEIVPYFDQALHVLQKRLSDPEIREQLIRLAVERFAGTGFQEHGDKLFAKDARELRYESGCELADAIVYVSRELGLRIATRTVLKDPGA